MKRLRILSNVLFAVSARHSGTAVDDDLRAHLTPPQGSAIELCAIAAYTYLESYKSVWSAEALIGASVVHMVLSLFGCLVFQSERSVHALATLCMIQLSTVAILVLSACAYFFERQGDDYVADNWARLQDVVVPFETLHDVQDEIADNVNMLSIAGLAAAAASTAGARRRRGVAASLDRLSCRPSYVPPTPPRHPPHVVHHAPALLAARRHRSCWPHQCWARRGHADPAGGGP